MAVSIAGAIALTIDACATRRARAIESSYQIKARAPVAADTQAVVDIRLAADTGIAVHAATLMRIDAVGARGSILAGVAAALINDCAAVRSV